MIEPLPPQFERTRILLEPDEQTRLARAHVLVAGLGGVGSYCAEALARAGVGRLTIIDHDVVAPSNINRQLPALLSTVGESKAEVMAARIRDIRPETEVEARQVFFSAENAAAFDFASFDAVADAIDSIPAKTELIVRAEEAGAFVVSAMGAGNKLDPTRFEVADIYQTSVCPLARVMRKRLKELGVKSLRVVYSREEPATAEPPEPGKRVPGSVSFVPPVMGLILAGEIIKRLAARKLDRISGNV